MDYQTITYDVRGGAGVLVVCREEKLNALSTRTFHEIAHCLDQIEQDERVAAGVLTGKGRAFVAGADIGEYLEKSLADFVAFQVLGRSVLDRIERHPKPIIAAVNGYALGGGMELALACDIIVASANARFGLPESKLALLPGGGGTQRLPRLIGRYRAKHLIMTGDPIDAAEAYRIGIVSVLCDEGKVVEAALGLVATIRSRGPLAVQLAKRLINDGLDASLPVALSYEQAATAALFATRDKDEGIAAFLEKRTPRFEGQ